MPSPVLHENSQLTCSLCHAALTLVVPPHSRKLCDNGRQVLLMTDMQLVPPPAACTRPQQQQPPCVSIQWANPSAKLQLNGVANVLLESSTGTLQPPGGPAVTIAHDGTTKLIG